MLMDFGMFAIGNNVGKLTIPLVADAERDRQMQDYGDTATKIRVQCAALMRPIGGSESLAPGLPRHPGAPLLA